LDEFLVFLPYRRTFTPADAEKKLISIFVQFIKLVVLDVIKAGFLEMFQNGMRSKKDEPILGGHRKSPRG
jgi:hypothetical protein